MTKLEELFNQYDASHKNATNRHCHKIGIPMIIGGLIVVLSGVPLIGWIMFTVGWIFQLIGHYIEGSRPEFLTNPIFLIVGPLYFIRKLTRKN